MSPAEIPVKVTVNGVEYTRALPPRKLLVDFIRDDLGLTGTHVGCGMGECGACTVMVDGKAVNACQLLAVQADGAEIMTIEGLADEDGGLHPVQQAVLDNYALQCGFCTPGMILTAIDLLGRYQRVTEAQVREYISGNICRCGGYEAIVKAICAAGNHLEDAQQ